MKKRIKVAVLMGGPSAEREVSLASGKEIVKNLDRKKYKVFPIIISKSGIKSEQIKGIDVAFIALHGIYGEDGKVQRFLKGMRIPYTGPGVNASQIGIDKIRFRKLMVSKGIAVPKYVVVKYGVDFEKIKSKLGEPPYFVKPFNQGSSVGASFVGELNKLLKALNLAFQYSDKVLVDEYIKGREFTCAVLGNKNLKALPVIEIILKKGRFFDYKSKYTKGGADEIVPAKISESLAQEIQWTALKIYKVVGAKGFSRIDLILKDNKPVVLEINTIPGLTSTSLFPKAARAAGISYSRLLDRLINYAIEKN